MYFQKKDIISQEEKKYDGNGNNSMVWMCNLSLLVV